MFARVTWFQGSADRIDDGITAYRQQAVPGLSALQGNVGAALLVNRGTGAGAAISYWDSMQSLQASEEAAVTLRAQTATEGRMTIGEIDRFEVIIQERMAPPAPNKFVRVNDFEASPDKVNDVANLVRDTIPTLKAQKGFRAVLVGANRQTGRMFISSVWETAADREASDAAVQERRGQIAQVAGAKNVKVDLYESAFAEVKQAARA
jgi:heme-degrading monooxygenase HmoA